MSEYARCSRCGGQRRVHHGPEEMCVEGGVGTFKHKRPTGRASLSFSEREVLCLSEMLIGLREKRDLSVVARSPEATKIARKLQRAKRTIQEMKGR